MRVALLTNFIAPYRVPLLEALRDQVDELRVFVSTPMESDRQWDVDWSRLDVTVQRNLSWRGRYRDPLGFSRNLQIHFPYDTLPQLRRYAPEIIVSGELGMRSAQAALYRTLNPVASFMVWATLSEHSERSWGASRKILRRAILSRADGAFVNGESGARYIRRFGMAEDRIFRVNQPVANELFMRLPQKQARGPALRLIHSGALSSRKGLVRFMRLLLSWAARHRDKVIEICWLGDGEDRPALTSLELPGNVTQRFVGNRPYRDLPELYRDADLLFLPSLMDEWGLVVNEAMASGLPVLGSIYSQAVEELVQDGVTGWTFNPVVDATVIDALDRVFATPHSTLRDMGQAARRRIAMLTPKSAAERMASAIRTVADGRRTAERHVAINTSPGI